MSGFGVFVPGKLDASLESDQVGYNHVLILIFSEVNTVFNVLLAETCFFYNKHIGDVINKKKHDIFLFVDLLHFLIKLRSFVRLIEIGLKVRQVNQRFLTMKFLFLFLFIRWRLILCKILSLKQLNIKSLKLKTLPINRKLSEHNGPVIILFVQKHFLVFLARWRQCTNILVNCAAPFLVLLANFFMVFQFLLVMDLVLHVGNYVRMDTYVLELAFFVLFYQRVAQEFLQTLLVVFWDYLADHFIVETLWHHA